MKAFLMLDEGIDSSSHTILMQSETFPCYCTVGRIESWPWPSLYILENSGRPTPKYTKVGERLRHVIPGHMACSMACGGRACKYENPARWSEQEQAIKGVYSSWWVWLWGLHSCVGWKGAGVLVSRQQAEWGDVGLAYIPGFTSRPAVGYWLTQP